MTNIVSFSPRRTVPVRSANGRNLPAAIIIFPGVRYERHHVGPMDERGGPATTGREPPRAASKPLPS